MQAAANAVSSVSLPLAPRSPPQPPTQVSNLFEEKDLGVARTAGDGGGGILLGRKAQREEKLSYR